MRFNLKSRPLGAHRTPKQLQEASSTAQKTPEECPILRLPNEILLRIFRYLHQNIITPKHIHLSSRSDLLRVSLVCKAWNHPATCIHYESIQLRTVKGTFLFHHTLQKYPHMRKMVKDLTFPARPGVRCPEKLMSLFSGIVNLVESLDSLTITCPLAKDTGPNAAAADVSPRLIIPIAEGRHSDLKILAIIANENTPVAFPSTLTTSFSRLTKLSMAGVFLSKPLTANGIPILRELRDFSSTAGNAANRMDEWLLACPRLQTLALFQGAQAPLELLTKGNIHCLTLAYPTFDPAINSWLPNCTSMDGLIISWSIFSKLDAASFPPSLRYLWVGIYSHDQVSFDEFKTALNSQSKLKSFGILVKGTNSWAIENEVSIRALCMKLGVRMYPLAINSYCDNKRTISKTSKPSFIPTLSRVFNKRSSTYDKDILSWEMGKS